MKRLIEKILSFRGPEYRPFAIEVSQDEVRLAVYGGARGFDEPATAQTASHDDIEGCLLEGIELLEHSRLLSPSREPYYRRPHSRCVFFRLFDAPGPKGEKAQRNVELQRRALFRVVPGLGHTVVFSGDRRPSTPHELVVHDIYWHVEMDEVHLWDAPVTCASSKELDQQVAEHLENGWTFHQEFKFPPNHPSPDKAP